MKTKTPVVLGGAWSETFVIFINSFNYITNGIYYYTIEAVYNVFTTSEVVHQYASLGHYKKYTNISLENFETETALRYNVVFSNTSVFYWF